MIAIAMCRDRKCPRREDCYRFTAKTTEGYLLVKWDEKYGCLYFIRKNREEKEGNDSCHIHN